MVNENVPQHNPQEELKNLYTEYGELAFQLKIGQFKYMECERKLAQITGIRIQQIPMQQ